MKMHLFFVFSVLALVTGSLNIVNAGNELIQKNNASDDGCQCKAYTCSCCAYLYVPEIHLNDSACVDLSYLPDEYGISFVMTLGELTIYNETISVRNPPPICFGIAWEDLADICIHFTNLNVTLKKLYGCVQLEARLNHILVAKYKLGCFNLGGVKLNKIVSDAKEFSTQIKQVKLLKLIAMKNPHLEKKEWFKNAMQHFSNVSG